MSQPSEPSTNWLQSESVIDSDPNYDLAWPQEVLNIDRSMLQHQPNSYSVRHNVRPLFEGQQIGNYRLIKRIASGGFGDVYRGEHVELNNPFAIKVLHWHLADEQQLIERFRNEAMVLAGLQHENVVQVLDFGQHPSVGFYLVMEWLEGRTLHNVWRRKRVFPLSQIYALFSQLLDALDLAHKRGVIHRDLKPENMILVKGSRGRTVLKIVDFGIATMIHGQNQLMPDRQNSDDMIIGTPFYMSPEQGARRHDLVDHRADLYACGVILFELLTGRRLFATKDPYQILRHHIETAPPRLAAFSDKVHKAPVLQELLDRSLAKDPAFRYASATEMYEALAQAMQSLEIEPDEDILDTSNRSAPIPNLLAMAMGTTSDSENIHHAAEEPKKETPSSELTHPDIQDLNAENTPIPEANWSKALWLTFSLVSIATLSLVIFGLYYGWLNRTPSADSLTLPPVVSPNFNNSHNIPNPTIRRDTPLPLRDKESQPPQRTTEITKQEPKDSHAKQRSADKSGAKQQHSASKSGAKQQRSASKSSAERRVQKNRSRTQGSAQKHPKPKIKQGQDQSKRIAKAALAAVNVNKAKKDLQAVKVELNKSQLLTLEINSLPPFTQVYIDGKLRGKTPLKLQLPKGRSYFIQLKRKSYMEYKETWKAERDTTKTFKLFEELLD